MVIAMLASEWICSPAHAEPVALPDGSTWVLDEELLVQVRPPVPVGWLQGRTTSRWIVRWQPGDSVFEAELCSMSVDPLLGAVTTWPDAALGAVPSLRRPVRFDGSRFEAGPVVETIGAGDDDGDGNPGVTLQVAHPRVGEGEVYIRHTARTAWSGEIGPDGSITGTVTYEPEEEMLGASTWWLRAGIAQRAHRKQPSTFKLSPVADGTRCEGL